VAGRDIVIRFEVGGRPHEANLTAMFSHDHSDPIAYAKTLSGNYAVWAEVKEKAKELLTRQKDRHEVLKHEKRLALDGWYVERRMKKPNEATMRARVENDPEVRESLFKLRKHEHDYGQAKVVTEALWFQRSLIEREGDVL